MSINLTVVIDNDEAIKKFKELQNVAKKTTSSIVSDSDKMDVAIRKFGKALASLGVGFEVTQITKQIANIRGEFQQLEVAFKTMLGSKAEADALMADVVNFAATTPFDLQGVASGAKQLLAYGSAAEDVQGELRMLGDIAAGLSLPLGDMIYLYGTTRAQGRMFTQDLRQFTGRGIPLMKELADQFRVAESEVQGLVSSGQVGFEEMKKALVSMTSEGGKFYNLMEEQSKTITGQISNLEDSIDQMFNEIGKQTEGVISDAIGAAANLVENYEKVGRVLMDVVAAYGSYKTAMILVNAVRKVNIAMIAAETNAIGLLSKAIKSLNIAATLTNPYVLAGAAIAGATFAIYKWITAKSDEEKAVERVNAKYDEYKEKLTGTTDEAAKYAKVMADTNSSVYERADIHKQLIKDYPELLKKYSEEQIMLLKEKELQEELARIQRERYREQKTKRLSELESNYDMVVSWDKEEIFREINKVKGKLAELDEEEIRIKFEVLGDDEKIAKYEQDLENINILIAEYNSLKEQSDRGGDYSQEIDALQEEKRLTENLIKKLKEKKKVESGGDEQAAKEREAKLRRVMEEAHKAEMELRKAQGEDKLRLMEDEKKHEIAKIEQQIKETSDAEIKGWLEQKKRATEELWNNKIAKERGVKYDNVLSGVQGVSERQAELDPTAFIKESMNKNSMDIQMIFWDLKDKSATALRQIAANARLAMKDITDPEQLAAMSERVEEIEENADRLESPLARLGKSFKTLFSTEVNSEAWVEAFNDIKGAMSDVIEATQMFDDALDALGHGDALDGVLDGLNAAFDALDAAGKGAKIGGAFGAVGAAAGAAIGAVTSLVKSISQIHDKRNQRDIERLQEEIDGLTYSYDKLNREADKAHSTQKAKLIEEQNKNLERQNELIKEQMAEEEDKKKTDSEKMKQYQDQLDSINQTIEDNAEKAKEAYTGISFDAFYDNFVNTLADMDASSEDFAKNFEKMLFNAIINAFVAEHFKDRLKALRDGLYEDMKSGGELTEAEAEKWKKEYQALAEEAAEYREAATKITGYTGEDSSSSAASNGGFQTMSQETGSELNGRFTDIQSKVTEMRSFVMELMTTGKLQYAETINIRDIMIQLNGNVADIKTYTKVLPEMRDSLASMNKKLENL